MQKKLISHTEEACLPCPLRLGEELCVYLLMDIPLRTQTPSQPLQVYYTAKTLTTPYATAHNAGLLNGVKSAVPVIQYKVVQPASGASNP